jgi:hypothetical protein
METHTKTTRTCMASKDSFNSNSSSSSSRHSNPTPPERSLFDRRWSNSDSAGEEMAVVCLLGDLNAETTTDFGRSLVQMEAASRIRKHKGIVDRKERMIRVGLVVIVIVIVIVTAFINDDGCKWANEKPMAKNGMGFLCQKLPPIMPHPSS